MTNAQPLDAAAVEAVKEISNLLFRVVDTGIPEIQRPMAARIITDAYAEQRENLSNCQANYRKLGKDYMAHIARERQVREKLVEVAEWVVKLGIRVAWERKQAERGGVDTEIGMPKIIFIPPLHDKATAALDEAKKLEDAK